MFRKIFVLCALISFTSAQNNDECNSYDTNIVTINKNKEPFWYQKKYGSCIDGKSIKELPALTLHIVQYQYGNVVEKISGFEKVEDIFLDNLKLNNIPNFINLPSLKKVSLSKNKLTEIPSNLLQQSPAKILIFSSNQISTIDDNAIGDSVEQLLLTCNNLTALSSNWFKNPSSLEIFSAAGNKFTTLPDNMFKDFVNLKRLDLRNNQILSLGAGSISGPTKMLYLELAYNNISEIKANVFGSEIMIDFMDVQYNRLSFLHQGTLDKLKVGKLKIWGNPWQCPCKDQIHKWLADNNQDTSIGIVRDEDPSCIYAETFSKHCVPFVDDKLYHDFLKTFQTSPIKFC